MIPHKQKCGYDFIATIFLPYIFLELEEKESIRLTDEQARNIIKLCSDRNNATEF